MDVSSLVTQVNFYRIFVNFNKLCTILSIYIYKLSQFLLKTWKLHPKININIVVAFPGMHVSPAKHSYAWLPRMCDYRTDRQTYIQTDRHTDRRRTKWSLCAAMLRNRHNKVKPHWDLHHILFLWETYLGCILYQWINKCL